MPITIKHRATGKTIYTVDAETLSGADLSGANLRGANLRRADLRDANMSSADLSGADLRDANLSGANLRRADLSGANLRGADMSDADLIRANLRGARIDEPVCRMDFGGWSICIRSDKTTIGCETHDNNDWLQWGPDDVADMSLGASDWWRVHGEVVKAAIRCVMEKSHAGGEG